MRSMTKSPLTLAKESLRVARASLPLYSSPFSNKLYTQHQLFVVLVLRQFFQTDYRGIIQLLREWSDLRRFLQLKALPHFTTLQKAHQRLLKKGLLTASTTPSWIAPDNCA